MKLYRIKHIPTGLYWRPATRPKTNLTTKGKIYTSKPHWKWVGLGYSADPNVDYTYLRVKNPNAPPHIQHWEPNYTTQIKAYRSEFVIEEFES